MLCYLRTLFPACLAPLGRCQALYGGIYVSSLLPPPGLGNSLSIVPLSTCAEVLLISPAFGYGQGLM